VLTKQSARHKTGVLVSGGVNLDLDYEPMLEALFSVGEPAKELKGTTTPAGHSDWEGRVFRIPS
jgi:hypothetical protein